MDGVDVIGTDAPAPGIGIVVTEHPSFVTVEQTRAVDALAESVSQLSGCDVSTRHYMDDSRDVLDAGALILTGSHAPWSAHRSADLEAFGRRLKACGRPVFGICAGMQLLASFEGARLRACREKETGYTTVSFRTDSELFRGLAPQAEVYQEHSDEVADLPDTIRVIASNDHCEVQALTIPARKWWGTQFHPELADEGHPVGFGILERAVQLLMSNGGLFELVGAARHGPLEIRDVAGDGQEGEEP